MKKLKKPLIFLFLFIFLILSIFFIYRYWENSKEDRFLSTNEKVSEAYAIVKQREKDIREDKENYDAYMSLAFHWKGIGEVLREDKYLWNAVNIYDEVIKRWGPRAYLPFINQANVYILLEEYEKAEENLKVAIDIDPGEQGLYGSLAELYRNYMKKTPEEIKAVYERGIKTVVGGANLVLSYAGYLREINEYAEALKYYKMLTQAYPTNTYYADIVKDLEQKVSNL